MWRQGRSSKSNIERGDGSDEQQVAVKKLRYYDVIDGRKFGNVGTMVFRLCWLFTTFLHLGIHEVDVIARLSHKNISKVIGFVEDLEEGKAWIILLWEPNGNISEFLAAGE